MKEVYLTTMFKKIGEIDTAKECFSAEVVIQAKWREESLDGISREEIPKVNFEKLWNPKLNVDNLLSEVKESSSYTVIISSINRKPAAFILYQKKLKGVFLENLELQEFPFDVQDLTVTISSEHSSKDVKFREDKESPSSVNFHSFVDEQEWKLKSEVRVENGIIESIVIGGTSVSTEHSYMNFKCTAERRYQYFLWNITVILVLICFMCFTVFSVNCTLPQNRLQLTFILLLTTVAFKTHINNSLPKISYLTYMDIYILVSWVLQCLMCVWHAIAGKPLLDHQDIESIDLSMLYVFVSSYVAFHIIFFLILFIKFKKRKADYYKLTSMTRL